MEHRRHVLHVLADGTNSATAQARIILPLLRSGETARYRHTICLFGTDGAVGDELRRAGLEVRRVPWARGARDLAGATRFALLLRRLDIDLLHQHTGGRSVRWVARRVTDARICLHAHSYLPNERPGARAAPHSARDADAVIANSRATAGCIVDGPVRVVYPGVRLLEPVSPAEGARPLKLVCVARMVHIKGHRHLLQAFRAIVGEFPGLELRLVGDGPEKDALMALARYLGVERAVQFTGWRPDPASVVRDCDVFVQPSLEEGFGMAAAEAMSAGLPVVASEVGGLCELIVDGQTGWLVPPADPQVLADRLRRVLGDAEQRRRFGAAGRERVRRHFSSAEMARRIYQLYGELFERGR